MIGLSGSMEILRETVLISSSLLQVDRMVLRYFVYLDFSLVMSIGRLYAPARRQDISDLSMLPLNSFGV